MQSNIKELFGAEAEDGAESSCPPESGTGVELESALAAAEDEADAAAAQAARAEAQGDLAEFDETLPLEDEPRARPADPDDLAALMSQVSDRRRARRGACHALTALTAVSVRS